MYGFANIPESRSKVQSGGSLAVYLLSTNKKNLFGGRSKKIFKSSLALVNECLNSVITTTVN